MYTQLKACSYDKIIAALNNWGCGLSSSASASDIVNCIKNLRCTLSGVQAVADRTDSNEMVFQAEIFINGSQYAESGSSYGDSSVEMNVRIYPNGTWTKI